MSEDTNDSDNGIIKRFFQGWIFSIILTGVGGLFLKLSLDKSFNFKGRIILFTFGILFQIPLIYFKIYRYFYPKED